MQTTHVLRFLFSAIAIALVAALLFGLTREQFSARAALVPTTVTVCKQVEDNNDADHTQGGTFGFIVADQSNTLGTLSLTRLENQSANAPVCSAPIAVPVA